MRPPDALVLRAGRLSLALPKRGTLVAIGIAVLLAAAIVASVAVGNGRTVGWRAVEALFGGENPFARRTVHTYRLPRALAGAVAGAALGLAGCLTQTLARNRLATPDLAGVNDGATVGVLVTVLGSTTATIGAWWAGPLGAIAAAALVVLIAGGMGPTGYRVLVVGLALSVTIDAVTELVLARQPIDVARGVWGWTIGSLNARGYDVAVPVGLGLAVLVPLALLASRRLNVLRYGDETATGLGVHPGRWRLYALTIAVLLAGLAVGVGGPIAFTAMAAPVLAARLAGNIRVPVLASALTGALLVVCADTLGRAFGPVEVPVGVLAGLLGGPFLLWVLLSGKD
ncbi:permease [Actinorhabdospora filicis]|uniref:Permease n=1 Tax=Actinorhabdospora filicis TaxID=1785913 RepID=A0A9W6W714_9ACTN|nr:iron ABC transporter permease [Actinorhabdospora filicis]GLZ76099.1 permease [Actinorhabdospora filicis]